MIPNRVLVNLSGGIDSAYCLYLALKAGADVLVHHINLVNSESRPGRAELEMIAYDRVMRWLERQRLPGRMTCSNSGTDFGTVRIIKDLHVWSFWTGAILTDRRHRDRGVIVSSHLDSPFMHDQVRDGRRRDLVRSICGFEPQWVYPIGKMLKADVVRACPEGLLRQCWWCRRPTSGHRPCHRCLTCRQVNSEVEKRGVDPDTYFHVAA